MKKGIIFDWIGTLAISSEELFPYSEKVLRKLHADYKLGLISITKFDINKHRKEIKSSGLSQYFRHVITDVIEYPEQYSECMKKMGTNPETTLVVNYGAEGIEIGNQLGCETIWIRSGTNEFPNVETGQQGRIISSIEDLIKIL